MRRGDLFVLSWESLRRVEWGKVSSFLSIQPDIIFHAVIAHVEVQKGRNKICIHSLLLHLMHTHRASFFKNEDILT